MYFLCPKLSDAGLQYKLNFTIHALKTFQTRPETGISR
jgi:hypothetical protein